MKVRDELSGQEFTSSTVVWILGENSGHTKRDRTISHGLARCFEVAPHFPGSKLWALNADHDAFVPVEVLP